MNVIATDKMSDRDRFRIIVVYLLANALLLNPLPIIVVVNQSNQRRTNITQRSRSESGARPPRSEFSL